MKDWWRRRRRCVPWRSFAVRRPLRLRRPLVLWGEETSGGLGRRRWERGSAVFFISYFRPLTCCPPWSRRSGCCGRPPCSGSSGRGCGLGPVAAPPRTAPGSPPTGSPHRRRGGCASGLRHKRTFSVTDDKMSELSPDIKLMLRVLDFGFVYYCKEEGEISSTFIASNREITLQFRLSFSRKLSNILCVYNKNHLFAFSKFGSLKNIENHE